MDPLAAREFRALIAELRGEGRTILLATHDMAEAEALCDRVTLIDRGTILATESPRSLGRVISRFQRIDVEGAGDEVLARIAGLGGVASVAPADVGVRIEVAEEGVTAQVLKLLVDEGVTSVRTSLPSLEEVYVHLIGDRGLQI
jgi:ABC-2 type transport system ATP-binding protein